MVAYTHDKESDIMGYKDYKVLKVVKVPWDGLWHIHYFRGDRETYDRVSTKEAVEVADHLWELKHG